MYVLYEMWIQLNIIILFEFKSTHMNVFLCVILYAYSNWRIGCSNAVSLSVRDVKVKRLLLKWLAAWQLLSSHAEIGNMYNLKFNLNFRSAYLTTANFNETRSQIVHDRIFYVKSHRMPSVPSRQYSNPLSLEITRDRGVIFTRCSTGGFFLYK